MMPKGFARRYCAIFTMTLYTWIRHPGNTRNRMRPPPPTAAGLMQRGIHQSKKLVAEM